MSNWYPHVTVACVIVQQGRFLLVEEESTTGGTVFNQPAGHLDAGETLQQAAVRETLEETGHEVVLDALLGSALYTSPEDGITYHRTTFVASVVRALPNPRLDRGIVRTHWLSHAEILAESGRMRSPLVLASVEQYLAGKRWPLDFIYYT